MANPCRAAAFLCIAALHLRLGEPETQSCCQRAAPHLVIGSLELQDLGDLFIQIRHVRAAIAMLLQARHRRIEGAQPGQTRRLPTDGAAVQRLNLRVGSSMSARPFSSSEYQETSRNQDVAAQTKRHEPCPRRGDRACAKCFSRASLASCHNYTGRNPAASSKLRAVSALSQSDSASAGCPRMRCAAARFASCFTISAGSGPSSAAWTACSSQAPGLYAGLSLDAISRASQQPAALRLSRIALAVRADADLTSHRAEVTRKVTKRRGRHLRVELRGLIVPPSLEGAARLAVAVPQHGGLRTAPDVPVRSTRV